MENSQRSLEADGFPALGARRTPAASLPVPADFVTLRLVLQPSGATVELTQPDVLIGRHSLADIRLPLPDVSRRHCRMMFSQGHWQIIDLNSLNGVYLNGEPVRQATVRAGDMLRIGGFTFVVELGQALDDPTETEAYAGFIRVLFDRTRLPSAEPPPQRRAS
jgi:pSer/pThr/pTyr-binding forkhead associated (FHA) protein